MSTGKLDAEVVVAGRALRNVARNLADCFDEFWPEYPEAVDEHIDALERALDAFGRAAEAMGQALDSPHP